MKQKKQSVWYVSEWIYRVLQYLSSIAILTTTNRPCTLRLAKDPSHRSLILAILHSRQPTLWLYDFCLENLHVNELGLFGAKAFPLLVPLIGASDIVAVGTTLYVFSYDGVLAQQGASRPSFKPRSAIWKGIEFEFLFSSGVCKHA